jgi:integral membrane protein
VGRSLAAVQRGVLVRYRIMAFTTAVLLIVLVFAGIPLQAAAGNAQVVNVVGTLHGFLYIVYLVTAFQLTRKLGVPKWQMLLVLLAGTVPFCAFVAERKMTRRFEARAFDGGGGDVRPAGRGRTALRRRWLSPRAMLLHVEVLVVAPGCVLAGWWQATRALAGNQLSWVYSVEWPIFAGLAIFGWWHLVHEDPEAFRARRLRSRPSTSDHAVREPATSMKPVDVDAVTAAWAAVLAAAVAVDLLVGIVALVIVPFGRPSGWVPQRGAAVYGIHATLGLFLALGAVAYLVRVRGLGRMRRACGGGRPHDGAALRRPVHRRRADVRDDGPRGLRLPGADRAQGTCRTWRPPGGVVAGAPELTRRPAPPGSSAPRDADRAPAGADRTPCQHAENGASGEHHRSEEPGRHPDERRFGALTRDHPQGHPHRDGRDADGGAGGK